MNSRERVRLALEHREPDRIPLDLGAGFQTGMHVSMVYALRQALELDDPGTPIKVIEPYQMLGEIKIDLLDALGADLVGVNPPKTMFGYKNEGWKPWTTFDGTPVLVSEYFNTQVDQNGDLLAYPEGDKSVPPSGRMPQGGFYFDSIIRQEPIDDVNLSVADNLEEFGLISDEDLAFFGREVDRLYIETDRAIYANFGGTAIGDIALVPAPWLKHPKGIRDIEEWYISTLTRRNYVYQIFEQQTEISLQNLAKIFEVVGNKVQIVFLTGTDFGAQDRAFMSPKTYRDLYKPFHKAINDWVHENTTWKTFMHSDGAILSLIPDIIEAGFDILNPIQWTAKDMELKLLKERFGDQLVFWGGSVDSQGTFPFGTPEQVRAEVLQSIRDLAPGGGYIFNSIHNIQPGTPIENLLAFYETIQEHRQYPIVT
ncbi:MAG: methyltransferase [Anaerolineales bacterium]|nr:methyltransferase [Anaerolineales bacterium]